MAHPPLDAEQWRSFPRPGTELNNQYGTDRKLANNKPSIQQARIQKLSFIFCSLIINYSTSSAPIGIIQNWYDQELSFVILSLIINY